MLLALGLIETVGLVGAIEAADAMLKASNVKLVAKEKVTGALINIRIVGEVAAVKSAVDAGAAAAQRVGQLVSAHVIPRPDDQIEDLIYQEQSKVKKNIKREQVNKNNAPKPSVTESTVVEKIPTPSELEDVAQPQSEDETNTENVIVDPEKFEKITDDSEPEIETVNTDDDQEQLFDGQIPTDEELDNFNVHELRRHARSLENFPIKGRDISKANRQVLIDYFKSMR